MYKNNEQAAMCIICYEQFEVGRAEWLCNAQESFVILKENQGLAPPKK